MTPVLEVEAVADCARGIAAAIAKRDRLALSALLSSGFVHRTPGGDSVALEPFLQAIEQIPGEILAVTLEQLVIDVVGDAALATGMQHAKVRLDGQVIDDRRAFVDWFIKEPGGWRLRVAAELPGDAEKQS
jgi:ketosteroid isomerase-like protein